MVRPGARCALPKAEGLGSGAASTYPRGVNRLMGPLGVQHRQIVWLAASLRQCLLSYGGWVATGGAGEGSGTMPADPTQPYPLRGNRYVYTRSLRLSTPPLLLHTLLLDVQLVSRPKTRAHKDVRHPLAPTMEDAWCALDLRDVTGRQAEGGRRLYRLDRYG